MTSVAIGLIVWRGRHRRDEFVAVNGAYRSGADVDDKRRNENAVYKGAVHDASYAVVGAPTMICTNNAKMLFLLFRLFFLSLSQSPNYFFCLILLFLSFDNSALARQQMSITTIPVRRPQRRCMSVTIMSTRQPPHNNIVVIKWITIQKNQTKRQCAWLESAGVNGN